jgi:hypothetical protein
MDSKKMKFYDENPSAKKKELENVWDNYLKEALNYKTFKEKGWVQFDYPEPDLDGKSNLNKIKEALFRKGLSESIESYLDSEKKRIILKHLPHI